MPWYRLVGVASDRTILRVEEAYCANDEQAEMLARGKLEGSGPAMVTVDIWETSRLVRRVQREKS